MTHRDTAVPLLGDYEIDRMIAQEDLPGLARELVDTWRASPPREGALVVGLLGELGAGKTTFVQYVAHELGVVEAVTSPTFVIQKSYRTADPTFHTLVHMDAYRIEHLEELNALKWKDLLQQRHTLVLIEWFSRIEHAFPKGAHCVSLLHEGDTTRRVTYGPYNVSARELIV